MKRFLQQLFRLDNDRAPRPAPRPARCRPSLEVLEGRLALAAGALDTGWGPNGKVIDDIWAGWNEAAVDVAIQSNGRPVVVGFREKKLASGEFTADLVVARYRKTGVLDPTFSSNGVANIDFGSAKAYGLAVAIDPLGKIVVAGYVEKVPGANDSFTHKHLDFAVARFASNGNLDTTFGGTGMVTTSFGAGGGTDMAFDLVIDGTKIVVAGVSNSDVALARYNDNGTLDSTFGGSGTGKVTSDVGAPLGLPNGNDRARAIAVYNGNYIVGASTTATLDGSSRMVALRYTPAGVLDTTLNGGLGGRYISGATGAEAIAIQLNGQVAQIVLAGRGSSATTGHDYAVARLNADFTMDTAFGTSGLAKFDVGGSAWARGVGLASDGKIVVAGNGRGSSEDHGLARLNNDGTLDAAFATGGKRLTDFANGWDTAYSMAIASDGLIYTVGGINRFTLARYKAV